MQALKVCVEIAYIFHVAEISAVGKWFYSSAMGIVTTLICFLQCTHRLVHHHKVIVPFHYSSCPFLSNTPYLRAFQQCIDAQTAQTTERVAESTPDVGRKQNDFAVGPVTPIHKIVPQAFFTRGGCCPRCVYNVFVYTGNDPIRQSNGMHFMIANPTPCNNQESEGAIEKHGTEFQSTVTPHNTRMRQGL